MSVRWKGSGLLLGMLLLVPSALQGTSLDNRMTFQGCNHGFSCHFVTLLWGESGSDSGYFHARLIGEHVFWGGLGGIPVWYYVPPHPYGTGGYQETLTTYYLDGALPGQDQLWLDWEPHWQPAEMSVLIYYGDPGRNYHLEGLGENGWRDVVKLVRVPEPPASSLLTGCLILLALLVRRDRGSRVLLSTRP